MSPGETHSEGDGSTSSDPRAENLTRLLRAAGNGDESAAERLFELVYAELHVLAKSAFGHRPGHVMQPTALVHEAWFKLAGNLETFEGSRHFIRTAGRAMRQVLSNHAEAARALKRDARRIELTTLADLGDETGRFDAIALEDALTKLAALNERHARVAELRFLCSFTVDETAEALGVSRSTVESDWAMARAWLRRELRCD